MTSVDGVTPEYADAIEESSIVSAGLSPNGSLILEAKNGEQYNLGALSRTPIRKPESSIITIGSYDSEPRDVVAPWWVIPADRRLSNPTSWQDNYSVNVQDFPVEITETIISTAWSPDAKYLAMTLPSTELEQLYLFKYPRFAAPSKLTTPSDVPIDDIVGSSWSPDGKYLALSHVDTPYVTVYERSGDVFTKLTAPAELPTSSGRSLFWSPDGQYLAISHESAPYFTVYEASSGSLMKIPDAIDSIPGMINDMSWSATGKYLSIALDVSPYLVHYTADQGVLQSVDLPGVSLTTSLASLGWSPDNRYLALVSDTVPCLEVAALNSGSFVMLDLPHDPSVIGGKIVRWAPDARWLLVGYVDAVLFPRPEDPTNNYATSTAIYHVANETFELAPQVSLAQSTPITCVDWSPDSRYIAIGHEYPGRSWLLTPPNTAHYVNQNYTELAIPMRIAED